ncbi:ATP-binding protein [Paenibacillus sp. SC116]|uniref:sensor histidine kinase n=1 Tax=Paenibacillus sp. SC116 TaxID=2968986 RepID=UPI00215AA1BA|nr:ATP-binding protein [Paenibacillus sp. SC116]MCR8844656.1 ATP-binding protein [Paenibacillus sp. SC116]
MFNRVQNNLKLYVVIIGLLCIVVYLTFASYFAPPRTITIDRTDGQQYVVHLVLPGAGVYDTPIKKGDRILKVDGIPVHEYYSENDRIDGYYIVPGAVQELTILKPGNQVQTALLKDDWREGLPQDLFIVLFILSPIFLILFSYMAYYLWKHKRDQPDARILIVCFLTIGISFYGNVASYSKDVVGGAIIMIALPAIPYIFMHFMNVFLEKFNLSFISKKVLTSLFVIDVIVSVLAWSNRYVFKFIDIKGMNPLVLKLTIAIGYGICLFRLIYLFLRHRHDSTPPLFKIFLVVHIVAFTPFILLNVIMPYFFNGEDTNVPFSTLFLFSLPISYMYLVSSKQIFDIDFIVTRLRRFLVVALLPAVIIVSVIAAVVDFGFVLDTGKLVKLFIVMLLSITLLLYGNEILMNQFRSRLFSNVFNGQDSLERFSSQLSGVMKHTELEQILGQELTEMLPLCSYQFFDIDLATKQVSPLPNSVMARHASKTIIKEVRELRIAELVNLSDGILLVLGCFKHTYRVVWLSNKSNHTKFNPDEWKWLQTITRYASLVYENLYSVERMVEDLQDQLNNRKLTSPWMSRLLFCLSENERQKLASDLHDAALQDQIIWYRKLETSMIDYPMSRELQRELLEIREGLLDVIHQIRETCQELRPQLLKEMGLVESLRHLIEHELLRVNFSIELLAFPVNATLSNELMTGVYRIVQELLRNTDKHAQADCAIIELRQSEDYILFRYTDNGIGMDEISWKHNRMHMGLSSIHERVRSLEGEIKIVTSIGGGFDVHIRLPVKLSEQGQYSSYIYMVE